MKRNWMTSQRSQLASVVKRSIVLMIVFLTGCVNQAMLDAQPLLVEQNTNQLQPQKPEVAEVYYVGFAADSSLKVFSNEVNLAKSLLEQQFGLKGRSAVLLNNSSTSETIPMATSENLNKTLSNVANIMDTDNDVLFLFLSGHGTFEGNQYGLYTYYGANHKGLITPEELKRELDTAGFKWRVVVVSACFSGRFANELKGPNTMVITASDPHQPSFGCSSADQYTYFGEAFFKNGLSNNSSLTEAFNDAIEEIAKKERDKGFEHSNPMLVAESPIRNKLASVNLE
ncbi:C13 family peptidase [Vibrio sp. SCSIO 43135]|uniref:C13 family peptidase n=1 Tax=Vibrio sp. SCSIO 43135 TaxID=2819096 RepID=UPI00207517E2|nr:C13 family peptidase [Vibrio sp. SCSIO 43135]